MPNDVLDGLIARLDELISCLLWRLWIFAVK